MILEPDSFKVGEDSPIESTNSHLKQYYFTNFFADESIQNFGGEIINEFSPENNVRTNKEVIEAISSYCDIRTSRFEDILNLAETNFNSQIEDWNALKKEIMKKKKVLKRVHAKNRSTLPKVELKTIKVKEQVLQPEQEDLKKKRNRMSAQISRDRKKEHVKELQRNYQLLRKETEQMKNENEWLRKQLKKSNENSTINSSKNKFVTLLMLLGIIFLISLIKDFFKPNTDYNTNLIPFNNKDNLLSSDEQTELIDKSKQLLSEMDNDAENVLNEETKTVVISSLTEMKKNITPLPLEKKLLHQIKFVQRQYID